MGAPPRVPARLPVLPLRDTVTFPDTLTPLAVGQERSVRLVNDVLGGDRMLAMVASRDPELESPGPEQLYEVGVLGTVARMLKVPDGTLRILVQAGPRVRLTGWAEQQPYLVADVEEAPDVLHEGPELTALVRNVQQTFSRIIEDVPYLPEELQLAVANLEDPSALAHLIGGALRIKAEEKQELLEERDVARRLRRLSELLARELEVAAIGSRIQSQVQSELDRTQREYVLRQQLKAIQEELGERDPAEAEVEELREQLAQIDAPRGRRPPDRARARAAGEAAAGGGRARRDPHVPGVDRLAAVGPPDRGQPGPRACPRGARRRSLRHRARQGPHPRVPRRAQAQAGRARLDPVLRRPAGRGQDVARPLHRPRARAQVRAHQRGRRARRGGDPRPPPDLHRRDARHDHPRAPRRRVGQSAVHDRRDRQDGRGLPRRPRERDARGARPGAERELPRPLPRRAVRPLARHVHHDREHARHGPGAAARPHGGDRARRLHRGGEARRSPGGTSCRGRSSATASSARRSRSPTPA